MKKARLVQYANGLFLIFIVLAATMPVIARSNDSFLQGTTTQAAPLASNSYYPDPNLILSNLSVRRALAFCTDRWALARAAYPGLTNPEIDAIMMDSFFPKDHWAYTEPATKYPYSPTQGQILLDQAGWTLPGGATYRVNAAGEELALVLTTTDASLRETYATVLEAQWQACGVHLVRLHAAGDWVFGDTTGIARRDFEIAGFAWIIGTDTEIAPMYACDKIPSELNGWQGQNYMGWCNPTASTEAYLGDNTSLSQAERKAHYAIVQEQFAIDMPSLPLFLRDSATGTWEHLDFNFTSPPPPPPALKDVTFRRALAYCTNRWALARAAYPGLTNPEIDALMMDSFLPKDHWAYTEPTMKYPYSPIQGQTLLEQAGWTLPGGATYRVNAAGEELALVLTTSQLELRYAWAEALEAQWLTCGIRLVRLYAPGDWLFGTTTGLARRNFDVAGFAWTPDADPQIAQMFACDQVPSELNGWSGSNLMGWCNPTASTEAYLGDNTSLTQAERKAHYAIVQEEFAEDVPSLPLFLRSPVDGTWEHIDFNMYTPLSKLYLPFTRH
jgi:ABC-type transport system substrate-binding protein